VKKKFAGAGEKAIFKLFSLGVSTNRDDWVYATSVAELTRKIKYLNQVYERQKTSEYDPSIKWSRNLKRRLEQGRREPFARERMREAHYRPFVKKYLYTSDLFIDESGARASMFPPEQKNSSICFSDIGFRSSFCTLAVDGPADLHFGASVDAYQQLPRYRYTPDGSRIDNITDWALEQFRAHYGKLKKPVTKDAIFHYVYAVLHDPLYREKYALNLKREFPRIPCHADFWRWAGWGEALMALHIGYETIKPWPLKRIDAKDEKAARAGLKPKPLLKADKAHGIIILDSETQLSGVPGRAWDYRLGNRSGLEWILDQYKEKTPKDPTIREKFNTYRFADHKEKVVDLLMRVARVSVETQEIVEAMRALPRA
jgi:predicted helicase